jgi:hypothetical protein
MWSFGISPHFGKMYQEKSGNPDAGHHLSYICENELSALSKKIVVRNFYNRRQSKALLWFFPA